MKGFIYTLLTLTIFNACATRYRDKIDNQTRDTCRTATRCCSCSSCRTPSFCNKNPYCGPFTRRFSDEYHSFKDNTKMKFCKPRPCAPVNDSLNKGYLYKGMWWDTQGVRYWAIRNKTNNTITVQGLEGGESKDIPSGDVVNVARGESYTFRVQAPARRFELFNSDEHYLEVYINVEGDIRYRVEPKPVKQTKTSLHFENNGILPKF